MKKLFMVSNDERFSAKLIKTALVPVIGLALGLGFWIATAPVAKAEDKCVVCHVPPGNPGNPQTLTIGCSAVQAHLRNHPGDCLGPCPCQPTPVTNP